MIILMAIAHIVHCYVEWPEGISYFIRIPVNQFRSHPKIIQNCFHKINDHFHQNNHNDKMLWSPENDQNYPLSKIIIFRGSYRTLSGRVLVKGSQEFRWKKGCADDDWPGHWMGCHQIGLAKNWVIPQWLEIVGRTMTIHGHLLFFF